MGDKRLEGVGCLIGIEFTEDDVNYINKVIKRTLIDHGYLDEDEGFDSLDNFNWEIKVNFSREVEEFVTMDFKRKEYSYEDN